MNEIRPPSIFTHLGLSILPIELASFQGRPANENDGVCVRGNDEDDTVSIMRCIAARPPHRNHDWRKFAQNNAD